MFGNCAIWISPCEITDSRVYLVSQYLRIFNHQNVVFFDSSTLAAPSVTNHNFFLSYQYPDSRSPTEEAHYVLNWSPNFNRWSNSFTNSYLLLNDSQYLHWYYTYIKRLPFRYSNWSPKWECWPQPIHDQCNRFDNNIFWQFPLSFIFRHSLWMNN